MAGSQFKNNATATLSIAMTPSSLGLAVSSVAEQNRFPEIPYDPLKQKWFYATIYNEADPSVFEIVKVTQREPAVTNWQSWEVVRGQEGTTAQSWPIGSKVEQRITAAGLSDLRPPSVQVDHFTTIGTSVWTKPAGAKLVFFQAWGAGGGGGSGRRRAIASQSVIAAGGAGGSGGGYREAWVNADVLGSSVNITIVAGGSGGLPQANDNTDGNPGGLPATTNQIIANVFSIPNVTGTAAPGGGTAGTTGRPSPVSQVIQYADTQLSSTNNGRGGSGNSFGTSISPSPGSFGGGGGGGGGGYAANSTSGQNGEWGAIGAFAIGMGVGGANSFGTSGNPGERTSVPANLNQASPIGGGGGGGGNAVSFTSGQAQSGQAGGNGGWPGGGGGGGSASQGANSGAGGDGGSSYIRITTFF